MAESLRLHLCSSLLITVANNSQLCGAGGGSPNERGWLRGSGVKTGPGSGPPPRGILRLHAYNESIGEA